MSVTLVLGGAGSGKSRFAESLCGKPRSYIATAQGFDDEMRQRISKHKADRGSAWVTLEAPLDVVGALKAAKGDVLLDCLTLWLTNVMMAEKDHEAEVADLLFQLSGMKQKVVIVSNELGMGLVPEHGLGRRFRDAHGRMNQAVAARAGTVIFMVAGIPQVIKGPAPT